MSTTLKSVRAGLALEALVAVAAAGLGAGASAAGDADSVTQNLMAQGMAAYKERQFSEAAGNFQLAVHRNPNDAKAQHYLALASARSGDMRTAVKALEIAISLDAHNVNLLKDAGTIFRQAGLLVKAEARMPFRLKVGEEIE